MKWLIIDWSCKNEKGYAFNQISNSSSITCLGSNYCGLNSYCSFKDRSCKCLANFQVSTTNNMECGIIFILMNELI